MTKREHNLVIIMICAAVIGLGTYIVPVLFPSESAQPQSKELTDIENQTKIIVTQLNKLQLSPQEIRILDGANTPWTRDPFFTTEMSTSAKSNNELIKNFLYSGFLETSNGNFAIINGMDYGVGDRIEDGDFEITEITANYVTLQTQNGSIVLQVPYDDSGTM